MVALNILYDNKLNPTFARPFSDSIFECAMPGSGTEKTLDVPRGKRSCLISSTGSYGVATDATAAMPSSSDFTSTTTELNTGLIWLTPDGDGTDFPSVSVLHFVSNDSIQITVSFYD